MGLKISGRYEQRNIIFAELLLMVEELSNGICYLSLPLDEIIIGIDKSNICKKLKFPGLFSELTCEGMDFPDAWKSSVYASGLPLKKDEIDKLINLGLSLGHSDGESQRSIIKLYAAQFNLYAEEAYYQRKKNSFTSMFTGFLFGGAVFILLI